MHRLIYFMKNLDIACFLHCFGEGNFQTLDMSNVMTSGNKFLIAITFCIAQLVSIPTIKSS